MSEQPALVRRLDPIDSGPGNLEDLVAAITDRLQAGECVDLDACLAAHPGWAQHLRELLPALQAMAQIGRELQAAGGGHEAWAHGDDGSGVLGDFRIMGELGRGGMGVVYEAEQISLARRVALKVLPRAAAMDPRRLQRFHNETRAAACLHHSNIVPVHAVGCERGVHYYAMQLIDGQTLAEALADLRLQVAESLGLRRPDADPAARTAQSVLSTQRSLGMTAYSRQVAELGVQAAAALDHAHQMGVVHCDVKPANLMLDAHAALWITDFGLAQLQPGTGPTLNGDLMGTLRYMSPEQALARRVLVDHRTDIYSLGATLYELLTLEPIFADQDRQALRHRIAWDEPTPLRRLDPGIPAELETIVLKSLEKNPQDRYATAQELADDLGRFLKDEPIRARRPGLFARGRKWSRRHEERAIVMGAQNL